MLPCLLLTSLLSSGVLADDDKDELTFKNDVLPIFRAKCIRCHAGVEPKAGLNLTSPSSLFTGGDSGAALRIRAAEFSLLYKKISAGEMPPVGQKLSAEERGVIRKWIKSGAEGVSHAKILDESADVTVSEHWSFQPPERPEVPAVTPNDRIRNSIDAFVLHQLQEKGLTFSQDADHLTLVRRAAFDLTGLPPKPAEVDPFINHDAHDAFDDIVAK
jgi:hypothetical protein